MKLVVKSLVIFVFILASSTVNAQNFKLGIKGGVNYASISEIGNDDRLGLTGGIFFGFKFNALSLQAEALFSQQGDRFNQNDIETDYALVPVIAKLNFLKIFNLQFGPQFSYLINSSDILRSEQLDISGAVGLGVQLGPNLEIEGRYNYGFTDAFKGASGENRFISLALAYSFL